MSIRSPHTRRLVVTVALGALVVAGCSRDEDVVTAFGDEVRAAIADAAAVAGIDPEAIALVEATAVTWRDGSLGCPEPDVMYTQGLVRGYRIVLEVEGARVDYHGAVGAQPFRCDTPGAAGTLDPDASAPAPAAPLPPDLARAVEAAIADAATAAGVAADEVVLVEAAEVVWSDGAIGCAEPDMMYTQALVEGHRIVLAVAGERVRYHAASGGDPFRCDDPSEEGSLTR